MIKCRFCHSLHVENTIFCGECGYYLPEDKSRETDPLDTVEMNWVRAITDELDDISPLQKGGESLAIRLRILPTKREVEMPLDVVTHLGRLDPAASVFPEIDLSSDSDSTHGVSRRHARIMKQGGMVVIEDMGSINGTFVNGKRLDPYLPEVLSDGDMVHLGKLQVEVRIRKK
jgi:pSer/pThr/pTyr-binding forkhead associated (FHA) protein